jgi:hypothetical protein
LSTEPRSQHLRLAFAVTLFLQTSAFDARSVSTFLRDLQGSVARDDRTAVSALVHYPLTVLAGGVRIPIRDAAALIQNYEVVFSPALKQLIARAALPARGRSAPAASVALSADFATIGVDAIRMEPVGGAIRITGITVPLEAPAPERTAGVSRSGGGAPDRLVLRVGRVQRAGALARGERDAYLLWATKNQLLEVRINGVSGRDVVARITDVRSSAPIDARARDGVRTWIGRIPADGDYRIDVVRLTGDGASELSYLMVVRLQ